MVHLNKKYYKLLNDINNKTIFVKDLPHNDFVVLLQCGYLLKDNPNFLSGQGLLALDEYRYLRFEMNKSSIILIVSVLSLIISIISLLISIFS